MRSVGRQCPAAPRSAASAGAQAPDHLVGVHSHPLGAAGGHRLLHRGGAHSARAHDLLRAIFHRSGKPPGGRLSGYVDHYHEERNHQGKDNVLLSPRNRDLDRERCVQCRERLGGFLRYYHQEAA
jgi:hypothetical protein